MTLWQKSGFQEIGLVVVRNVSHNLNEQTGILLEGVKDKTNNMILYYLIGYVRKPQALKVFN